MCLGEQSRVAVPLDRFGSLTVASPLLSPKNPVFIYCLN
jgi:hypothetical protein